MRRHWGALLGLLCIQVCWVRGMTVEQSPSALRLQEGDSSTLKCNFSETARSVQWFRQHPRGDGLMGLFYIASGMKQSGRLNCTVNTKDRSSTLHIRASRLEDSATYLCAAQAQCSRVICSLHPNCSWACRPRPSPGWALASTAAFAHFQIFRFM
uniref:Ig-like domain-containing protein n=1 Tax=Mustela putorius furo TaxID=9669 RepID=M3Y7Y3_MUSPF